MLSGLTVEEVKAGRSPVGRSAHAIEACGRAAHARRPEDRRADARRVARQGVHARRLAVRAQARRLSLDRQQVARRGDCSSRATATTTPPFSRRSRAPSRRFRSTSSSSTARSWCSTTQGKPSFARLQQRGTLLSRRSDVKRAAVELPATFFAFDFLAFEDFDLRPLPLRSRKELLLTALPKLGAVHPLDHIEREGEAFLAQVDALGLEGIIAKRADAPYRAGRTDDWLKIKAEQSERLRHRRLHAPKGGRSAPRRPAARRLWWTATLVYAGTRRHRLRRRAARRARIDARVDRSARRRRAAHRSALVERPPQIPETQDDDVGRAGERVRGALSRVDADGVLRHAAFLRMRYRQGSARVRSPGATTRCTRKATPMPAASAASNEPARPGDTTRRSRRHSTSPTSRRSTGPTERYTKGDLIEYYRAISPWMLPYLRNRPLVMTRFPDGIDGKSFYQKDAPEFAPSWIARSRSGARTRSATSATSSATTSSRCSTSPTSARSRSTSGQPSGVARAAGLVRDRPRSEGGAVLRRDQARRSCFRALCEVDRPAELREDDRQDGPPHPDSARPAVHVRAVAARSASCSRASRYANWTRSRRSRAT